MLYLQARNWPPEAEAPQTPEDLRRLLLARAAVESPEAERIFFEARQEDLLDPFLFRDMELAVELIEARLETKGKILIYGDYDCDGLSSSALLMRYFRAVGTEPAVMIPNRLEDGYGLGDAAVEEILRQPPSLVITVDCGSTSVEQIRRLMEAGIPVIVTDHHQIPEEEPPALAFLNPWRQGETYPFKGLAGVGVAFKLFQALNSRREVPLDIAPYLCLAALGTVADAMPLLGENRLITQLALQLFETHAPIGLELIRKSIRPQAIPDSTLFSFVLAPRLNAAGRMGDCDPALQILLADDPGEAAFYAHQLEEINQKRRELEQEIVSQAEAQLLRQPAEARRDLIIVGDLSWHPGVIGIVSTRLSETYGLPSLVMGGLEGIYRGSGRSVENFDLLQALRTAEEDCLSLGGHRAAAGFSLHPESLPSFSAKLRAYAAGQRESGGAEESCLAFCVLPSELVKLETAEMLQEFAPFGKDFEEPLFAIENLELRALRKVGEGRHLSLDLRLEDGRELRAIAFRMGDYAELYTKGDRVDLLGELEIHAWNGRKELQLQLKEIRPAREEREAAKASQELLKVWRSGHALPYPASELPLERLAGPFWLFLEQLSLQREMNPGLICRYFRLQKGLSLTPFSLGLLLDVFAEAGLLAYKERGGESLWLERLPCPGRPVLAEQPSWRRYRMERGGGDA